jgi:hypothetical protein
MATVIDKPAPNPPHEGKKVFSPNELNQAGEDKDYFHPDNNHKYDVPKDATDHALTPDIEVVPGNRIKPVTK